LIVRFKAQTILALKQMQNVRITVKQEGLDR